MRPRPKPVAALQLGSYTDVVAWAKAEAKTEPKRKRPSGITVASMVKAHREADRRSASDDWEGARPLVFVALYAILHEHVYGVVEELKTQDRKLAAFAAGRMLKGEFGGDAEAMASFLRWAWKREAGREKWRRDNGRQGLRLTWRLLFGGGYLMTDYRLDQLRGQGRR